MMGRSNKSKTAVLFENGQDKICMERQIHGNYEMDLIKKGLLKEIHAIQFDTKK